MDPGPRSGPRWVEAEWQKARALFERRLKILNNKILTFNLQLPPPLLHRQRARLKMEVEFGRHALLDAINYC